MNSLKELRTSWPAIAKKNIMLIIFIATVAVMFITTPSFRRFSNIAGLFNQTCIYGVAAMGMTIAIINAEFDMSMGGIVSLASLMSAWVMKYTASANPALSILAGIGTGALFGLINGIFIAKLKINTFIVTLATMVALYGLAETFCYVLGVPSSITYINDFMYELGNGSFLSITYFVWLFLLMIALTTVTLKYTAFGRNVYAVGGNSAVAKASGINVERNKMAVFLICGVTAGMAGVMMSAKMMTGSPQYANDLPLTTISAVVLGGTNMAGGSGGAVRTLLGLLILSLVSNIFNVLNINLYVQNLIKGLIIVAAVTISNAMRSRQK